MNGEAKKGVERKGGGGRDKQLKVGSYKGGCDVTVDHKTEASVHPAQSILGITNHTTFMKLASKNLATD